MKNVLILTTPFRPNVGGVETHLDDLIEAGVSKDYNFSILTYQPLVTKTRGKIFEKGLGYKVIRMPWIRLNLFLRLEKYPVLEFIYLFPGLFIASLIFLIFNNSKIQIIHSQGLVAGAIGVILGKIFSKKVIISTHSIYNFPRKGLYKDFVFFLFKNCWQILTLSNQSKNEILKLGLNETSVSTFTYWVNQKTFKRISKNNLRSKLGFSEMDFVCLFVGRLVEGKGVSELIEAAKLLPNIKFLVIGDGPMESYINKETKRATNIKFIGRVLNDKLPLYYNLADVLLVPSTHEEGFGRVILEASSCALPIIASKRGGIKESIPKGGGILIKITTSNIQKTLESLRLNRDKLKQMSKQAFDFAKKHYSESNAKMILKFYE